MFCPEANQTVLDGMENVVCVSSAKVPIVKIWDPELNLACDMNVNNTLALENTRMMRTYVSIDDRVRPLAMIIKHWTRRRIINDAGTRFSSPRLPLQGQNTVLTHLLYSLWWDFEFLHMDLHGHCIPPITRSSSVARASPAA